MPQEIYNARLVPIIEYAAAMLDHQGFSCISAIQNKAARYFMGFSKYTPNAAVQWEMDWKTAGQTQTVCVKMMAKANEYG